MALHPVPGDHLATVVTALEMRDRPLPRPLPESAFRLAHWPAPDSDRYRALFRRVGEPWLWYSRLMMDDARLRAIIGNPGIAIHAALDDTGDAIGMIELDFRVPAICELSYFGFVPELAGRGHGDWLIGHALALAWRSDIERVWVHTCTLDHPAALGFYRRHGFTAYKRTLETFPDPRLLGVIGPDVAPQIPCLARR